MSGRSLTIGKAGERGVVNALHRNGFPGAERRKAGRLYDALDITVCPGVVASVKAGEQAKSASLGLVTAWRVEAEAKRVDEGADVALLIVQRRGYAATRAENWRCWVIGVTGWLNVWEAPLADALDLLRSSGYGDPLTPDPTPED